MKVDYKRINIKQFAFLFWILIIFSPFFVKAEKIGITINKTFFSFDSKAGAEQVISLNIQNIFSEKQEVKIEVDSYDIVGDNNEKVFINLEHEKNINDWFVIEEKTFILEPKEARNISVKVKIPDNIKSNSYQGALFFSVKLENKKNNSVNEIGRVGAHVLINVINGEKYGAGEITELKIPFFAGNKINTSLNFKNKGNIHYVPYGEIKVKNIFKFNYSKKVIEKHFVFPDKEFNFKETKKGFFWLGLYKVKVAFIDAEGVTHEENRYVSGYLFWPLVTLILSSVFFSIKNFKKINKKRFDK